MTSSLRTIMGAAPSTTAPIANSGRQGTPILRTSTRSRGAVSAAATSAATGTPPRGSARITGFRPSYRWSAFASFFPASDLSLNDMSALSYGPGARGLRRLSAARLHPEIALEPALGQVNHDF